MYFVDARVRGSMKKKKIQKHNIMRPNIIYSIFVYNLKTKNI